MARLQANGITIEYERSGPENGEPLLLIQGVGAQLIRWPDALCARFAAAGFHVIRFDNRDAGLSTHMRDAPVPNLAAVQDAQRRGEQPALPYTLNDMADDTAALLDGLDIARTHVLGISLGGMIAQALAIRHRERVVSLNIFMSQSGNPDLPPSDEQKMRKLATAAPDPMRDLEGYLRHSVDLNQTLGSPLYPTPEVELREFARQAALRAYNPAGALRQLAAGRGSPDRRTQLGELGLPTLIVHGRADGLIPPESGEDIARSIPGAWLLMVDGMGHDLPPQLFELFASSVIANCHRATQ